MKQFVGALGFALVAVTSGCVAIGDAGDDGTSLHAGEPGAACGEADWDGLSYVAVPGDGLPGEPCSEGYQYNDAHVCAREDRYIICNYGQDMAFCQPSGVYTECTSDCTTPECPEADEEDEGDEGDEEEVGGDEEEVGGDEEEVDDGEEEEVGEEEVGEEDVDDAPVGCADISLGPDGDGNCGPDVQLACGHNPDLGNSYACAATADAYVWICLGSGDLCVQ